MGKSAEKKVRLHGAKQTPCCRRFVKLKSDEPVARRACKSCKRVWWVALRMPLEPRIREIGVLMVEWYEDREMAEIVAKGATG